MNYLEPVYQVLVVSSVRGLAQRQPFTGGAKFYVHSEHMTNLVVPRSELETRGHSFIDDDVPVMGCNE